MTQRTEWHKWYNDMCKTVSRYRSSNITLAYENEQLIVQNRLLVDTLKEVLYIDCQKKLFASKKEIQENEKDMDRLLMTILTANSPTYKSINNDIKHVKNKEHNKNYNSHKVSNNNNTDVDNKDNSNDKDNDDSSASGHLKNGSLHKKPSKLFDVYHYNFNLLSTIFEEDDDDDDDENKNKKHHSNNQLKKTNIDCDDGDDKKKINDDKVNNNNSQQQPSIESIGQTDFSFEIEGNDILNDTMCFDYERVSTQSPTLLSTTSSLLPQQRQPSPIIPPIKVLSLKSSAPSSFLLPSTSSSSTSSSDLYQFQRTLFSQHMPTLFPNYNNEQSQVHEQNIKFNLRRKADVDYKLPTLKSKLRKGDRHSFTL
ncbi:unnamed protein product [Cunninghamella blakesleeana]